MSLLCHSLFSHSLLLSWEAGKRFGAFPCPSPAPNQDSSSGLTLLLPGDNGSPFQEALQGVATELSFLPCPVGCPHSNTNRERRRNAQTSMFGILVQYSPWKKGQQGLGGRKLLISCSAQSIPASCRVFERLKKTPSQCIQPNMGSDALGGRKPFLGELVQHRMVVARSRVFKIKG